MHSILLWCFGTLHIAQGLWCLRKLIHCGWKARSISKHPKGWGYVLFIPHTIWIQITNLHLIEHSYIHINACPLPTIHPTISQKQPLSHIHGSKRNWKPYPHVHKYTYSHPSYTHNPLHTILPFPTCNRNNTLMFPPMWIVALLPFRVGLSWYVNQKHALRGLEDPKKRSPLFEAKHVEHMWTSWLTPISPRVTPHVPTWLV
jgi:hypothetical protein